MYLVTILHLFILFLSVNKAVLEIRWNTQKIEKSATLTVRRFLKEWENKVTMKDKIFHYKTNFGIIIKKSTKYQIEVETSSKIEALFVYCLSEVPSDNNNIEIDLKNRKNCTINITANSDCVPMASVTYNIPVKIKIITKNWITLPIFQTQDLTFLASKEAEDKFYKSVQSYGFVENYYTQMLLSKNDIESIKSANYSLFLGLQNQADLVQYYNYLTGASQYYHEPLKYYILEQKSLFFLTNPCQIPSIQNSNCQEESHFNLHSIVVRRNIEEFLNPIKGSSWILMHEIGHNYNIKTDLVGIGNTLEVWNNIFATLYQYKFSLASYAANSTRTKTLLKYKTGILIDKWSEWEKLHFFMSLFGFDGTDMTFREFHFRHFPVNLYKYYYFENIIPTLLEVFLDLHEVNILPFLQKVINFHQYTIPLFNPDLELRLMCVNPVMPAVDFNLDANDLPSRSKERDLRFSTPLFLLKKAPMSRLRITFNITPFRLINSCLYLNNVCYRFSGNNFTLNLYPGVYSSYIATKTKNFFYLSNVTFHTISKNMEFEVIVERSETGFSPLIYYSIDNYGLGDILFARLFINYKDMTIAISQFTNRIHYYFPELYYSVKLIRNNISVFNYRFFGMGENPLINVVEKFRFGDELEIYNKEFHHGFKINGEVIRLSKNTNKFTLTKLGLNKIDDNLKIILMDIERIQQFNDKHKIDLSYNPLFKFLLKNYVSALISNSLGKRIPNEW